jgi:5'(3')-deoxyribonucleotidase
MPVGLIIFHIAKIVWNNMDKTIAIDLDDVLCNLSKMWIKLHNKQHNANLNIEQVLNWDIALVAQNGKEAYKYFQIPELYDDMPVMEGALEGVNYLRDLGCKIIFATISSPNTYGRKYKWLEDNGFQPELSEYVECRKSKSALLGDIIIDDNFKNIREFQGIGLLFDRPWNWQYNYGLRVKNWQDIITTIKYL